MSAPGPDCIVAGAGGGLVAALRAAAGGLHVLVLEASAHFRHGNNTSMSTAMFPGAGSEWQRRVGIDDSPERFVADIMAKTHGTADLELATALADHSVPLVDWLAREGGLAIDLVTDFEYPGHSVHRCHSIPGRSGATVVSRLADLAETHPNIDLLCPARLAAVSTGATGVDGVTVMYPDGSYEEIATSRVLLATNGFGADRALVSQHIPEIARAAYHGSQESRGDALRIGTALGAASAFLDAYQGHAALATPQGTLVGWATVMHGAIMVNNDGRRFANETCGYSEFASKVLEQPGETAWLILDKRIDGLCRRFQDYVDTVHSGALRWATDVRDLASRCALESEVLEETLQSAAAFACNESRDPFGRTRWEEPLGAPFAAVRVAPALFHTQGGLVVDHKARVRRDDGSVVGGLWASGGAAMGISGHGADGYLAGNGLLSAFGLAFIAADAMAGFSRQDG